MTMIMQQNEKERKRSFDAIIIRRKKASDTLRCATLINYAHTPSSSSSVS